jgi:hypothetical protein
MGRSHFGVQAQVEADGKGEDERADRDRWQDRGPRGHVAQDTDPASLAEIDADLLCRLPDCRLDQVGVPRSATTARKADLAGPRVTGTLSPADEENRKGIGRENQGDGGPSPVRLDRLDRVVLAEAVGNAGQRGGERVGQWLVRVAGAAAAAAGRRAELAEVRWLAAGGRAGRERHAPLDLPLATLGAAHRGPVPDEPLEVGAAGGAVIVVDGHASTIRV